MLFKQFVKLILIAKLDRIPFNADCPFHLIAYGTCITLCAESEGIIFRPDFFRQQHHIKIVCLVYCAGIKIIVCPHIAIRACNLGMKCINAGFLESALSACTIKLPINIGVPIQYLIILIVYCPFNCVPIEILISIGVA